MIIIIIIIAAIITPEGSGITGGLGISSSSLEFNTIVHKLQGNS
ncbi:MAG TPA: hypothetical protein VFT71_06085 [Candidatus Nitrosocosmicus sp.]|nr:hypothetical protein [Candidatus Nitrosocosmicus sp.]